MTRVVRDLQSANGLVLNGQDITSNVVNGGDELGIGPFLLRFGDGSSSQDPSRMEGDLQTIRPGELIHTFGDAHLSLNHLEQARLQLEREPRALPTMRIAPNVRSIFGYRYEDFELSHYDPHPHIAAPIAV